MFVTSCTLQLLKRASEDYEDILLYTEQKWGKKQLVVYEATLNKALKTIAEHPQRGRESHGLIVYPVGKHCIFYRVKGTHIYVLRILHARMDTLRHMPE